VQSVVSGVTAKEMPEGKEKFIGRTLRKSLTIKAGVKFTG